MIASFPGHTHFFDRTHDIASFPGHTHFLTGHMTFRTHLALTFPFCIHLIGLSVGSVNKRPNYSQTLISLYSQTLISLYLLLAPKSVFLQTVQTQMRI